MKIQPPRNFSKLFWQSVVVLLVIAYVTVNIFNVGGDEFVITLNNNIANPLAIAVTFLALALWRQIAEVGRNRLLWSGLTVGWALWTVAEIWWGIASIIGQEVPYPSWADFFWLAGYIPMLVALWERIRSLPRNITPSQRIGLQVSILLSVGWTIWFVLIPIVQYNDPTAVLESALNILYPLVDIALLVLVLRIFFTYQQGMVGRAWGWLSAGFVLHSLSNLIFSYASTADLYYPDGRFNLLSAIGVDVPYNLSYLFWLLGLWIVRSIQSAHRVSRKTDVTLALVPNTHLLIYTKGDDTIIDVSRNYKWVFQLETVVGKTISEVLGISPSDADHLVGESRDSKILAERSMIAATRFGQKEAGVSGVSVTNPQGEYSGGTFLLRLVVEDYSLDDLMPGEQKRMVQMLLSRTGTKEKEEKETRQLLAGYYQAHFQGFYRHIFEVGGATMADSFFTELQSVVGQRGWQVDIRPEDAAVDVSALSLSKTREALPMLFESAKRFVAGISDDATADSIVQDVRSRFNASTRANVAYFEKARE